MVKPYFINKTKTKEKSYLPLSKKWSDPSKNFIEEEVYMKHLMIIIMNFFISVERCNADMYLNLSLYLLTVIGNYCQSMYYSRKVSNLELTTKEAFTLARLNIKISKSLLEPLKSSKEQCVSLEGLNVSMYYKYDFLSQKFVDEISKDVNLSLEFWKTFRSSLKDPTKKIDFNIIFELTDKIRNTKRNVEIMWNKLLGIYSGSNSFFDLYLEYVEEINDDELKKRDLESLKRKNENFGDHIGQNYYSILFNKETVILIVNGDKGNEGTIELTNKEIEKVFNYRPIDIKGMNLTSLMPKLFAKRHNKYIERYFKVGEKKLVDKNDYKTFGKDKNNSIIKIKLAVKLFPILNEKILFCGLINKENIDDIIIMDEKFNIQGMSSKLMKILNIGNKFLFQENEIPFYTICKKFIDFYNVFLAEKNTEEEQDLDESMDEATKKKKKDEKKETNKEEGNDNVEINENVELEYEIKLPQFLIDYAEKTNRKDNKGVIKSTEETNNGNEEEEDNQKKEDLIEEYDENDLLIDKTSEEKEETQIATNDNINKTNISTKRLSKIANPLNTQNLNHQTPTPGGTVTPGGTPTPGMERSSTSKLITKETKDNNHLSEEEKTYKQNIKEYKTLFKKGKFSELEKLIDNCNKDSYSNEFKFNFTFDRMKYGDNQVAYIVRCVDNKNDIGSNEQESAEEFDLKAGKYKKDKFEAIKPLYELFPEEKKEIIEMPEKFLKLSIENKKFQKLLQQCKIDIITMSKTHGEKKEEILEDENSSQTSQTGFDSGLVKKNRIEEIRRNLLTNVSNFFTLRYLRISSCLLGIGTTIFIVLYTIYFNEINTNLKNVSKININLFQSAFWTSELISILISLRTLFKEFVIEPKNFTYLNYYAPVYGVIDNVTYYNLMALFSKELYGKISDIYGELEMNIPNYLTDKELIDIYWDNLNVTFYVELRQIANETFPMSISQMLSNTFTYLEDAKYNINETDEKYRTNSAELDYFNYVTFLIIENTYDNIMPNIYNKLIKIPEILSKFNINQQDTIILVIIIYAIFIILICIAIFILIHITNKSMTAGLEKLTKIRLERIEETIKKIDAFNSNLKKFRDKDSMGGGDNKDNEESQGQKNKQTPEAWVTPTRNMSFSKKKGNVDLSAAINSSGFNTDVKKYIPLKVLNSSFFHGIIILVILCGFIIPTYIISIQMINNTNQLLIVENYIYGRLIVASGEMVEIKCFMSDCNTTVTLNYNKILENIEIQEVIRGINLFDYVNDFYNNKFLLDACAAYLDGGRDNPNYESCKNETLIKSANNTDNLIKLINDYVENINKEYLIEKNSPGFFKQKLFETTAFQTMEEIFYLYILPVGSVFSGIVTDDLNSYLKFVKSIVIALIVCLEIIMIIYCIYLMIFFVKKLVNYLSVSRCIMKIIPTSVIISTQELETWIESKY